MSVLFFFSLFYLSVFSKYWCDDDINKCGPKKLCAEDEIQDILTTWWKLYDETSLINAKAEGRHDKYFAFTNNMVTDDVRFKNPFFEWHGRENFTRQFAGLIDTYRDMRRATSQGIFDWIDCKTVKVQQYMMGAGFFWFARQGKQGSFAPGDIDVTYTFVRDFKPNHHGRRNPFTPWKMKDYLGSPRIHFDPDEYDFQFDPFCIAKQTNPNIPIICEQP